MGIKVTALDSVSEALHSSDLYYVAKFRNVFSGSLIVGATYTIASFVAGDDFANVANVQSGTINTSGCIFIATGTTPTNWTNSSSLTFYEHQKVTWNQIQSAVHTYKIYRVLLSQTGDGTSTQTSGVLVVGRRYAITTYVAGDDFSNVANVVSGTINTTGCEFIATGTIPTNYSNGSTLTDTAAPTIIELENTLGFTPVWSYDGVGSYKLESTGNFPINKVFLLNPPFDSSNKVYAPEANYSNDEIYLSVYLGGVLTDSATTKISFGFYINP